MKKLIIACFALLVLSTTKSFAQDAAATGPELSIGIDGGLPIGNFKTGYNFGIGGTAKFAYNFNENVAATLQSGFITFSAKSFEGQKGPAYKTIPVKAGVRYTFPGGFYGEPQFGLTFLSISGLGSTSGFTYAANVGYHVTPGIDISARYEGISKAGTISFIGLRIAYSFPFGSN